MVVLCSSQSDIFSLCCCSGKVLTQIRLCSLVPVTRSVLYGLQEETIILTDDEEMIHIEIGVRSDR